VIFKQGILVVVPCGQRTLRSEAEGETAADY